MKGKRVKLPQTFGDDCGHFSDVFMESFLLFESNKASFLVLQMSVPETSQAN
jgi:hypothetical protein